MMHIYGIFSDNETSYLCNSQYCSVLDFQPLHCKVVELNIVGEPLLQDFDRSQRRFGVSVLVLVRAVALTSHSVYS